MTEIRTFIYYNDDENFLKKNCAKKFAKISAQILHLFYNFLQMFLPLRPRQETVSRI